MIEESDIIEAAPAPETLSETSDTAAVEAPCEGRSPIDQWRRRAKRARTLRGAITVASVVIAVGGVAAGIIAGVVAAAGNVRKKK